MNLYEYGENQDSTSSIEPYYYEYFHRDHRASNHTKPFITGVQDDEMMERTNRGYEALVEDHVHFHERETIRNEFHVRNIHHSNHEYSQDKVPMSPLCKCRSTIVKPFKCGLCFQAFSTICQLHEHFDYFHREIDMYLFDKSLQTAFPKYKSSSVATQTNTELEQSEVSVVDRIVTTQTDAEIEQLEVSVVGRIKEELVDSELELALPSVAFLDSSRELYEQKHSDENGEEPGKSADSTYYRFTADDSDVFSVDNYAIIKSEVKFTEDYSEVVDEYDSEVVNTSEDVLVLSTEDDQAIQRDKNNILSSIGKNENEPDSVQRKQRNSDGNEIFTEQRKHEQNAIQETYANNDMNEIIIDDLQTKTTTPLVSDDGSCSFKCLYCTEKFALYGLYIIHVKEEHGKQTFCKICNKQFSRRKGYLRHLKLHKNPESCKCDKCHEMFPTVYQLNLHKKEKHFEYFLTCKKCGEKCPTRSHLHAHRMRCLNIKFPCTFENCGKTFGSKTYLKAHLLAHKGETPFVCEICGKGFAYRTNLRSHLTVHSEEKFTCNVCGKSYSHRKGLKDHESIHAEEVSFICEICGKTHKHWHKKKEEPRLFSCTYERCDKTYNWQHSLTAHLRTHTGEIPFKCDVCGDGFTSRSVMKNHKLQKHSKERPWKCDQCKWAFPTRGGLAKHKKTHTVTQDQMLPCDVCGKAFSNKWNLAAHVRQHTGEKPFVCEICGAAFTHKVSLKNHMKVHKAGDTQSTQN